MFTRCPICNHLSFLKDAGGCAHCENVVSTYEPLTDREVSLIDDYTLKGKEEEKRLALRSRVLFCSSGLMKATTIRVPK